MSNADFKHGEFSVMSRLWTIYKENYTITKAADLKRTVAALRASAAGFDGSSLAAIFAETLINDLERQAMENSGGDQTKTRGYMLGQVFAWYNKWMLADTLDWERINEEAGRLHMASRDRLVHDVIITLETDLEEGRT